MDTIQSHSNSSGNLPESSKRKDDKKEYVEQVWVYNSPQKEITAPTLKELMAKVNEEFGYN